MASSLCARTTSPSASSVRRRLASIVFVLAAFLIAVAHALQMRAGRAAGENENRLNYNQRAYWLVQVSHRWYGATL